MSDLNVLIVGASIAGPMAAYWFAKAGANVTVIERFPQLRTGGQNIDIRLTGVTIMRKIPGMEDAVRAALAPLDGLSFVREDGTPIAVMRSTGDAEQQTIVSEFEIFRGELSRIIFDLTKDHKRIKYIFNEQIASMQQQQQQEDGDEGSITVEFTNGTPKANYDLVVACDGATSRTRAMGFGCSVRDHIQPTGAWASYFTIPKDLLEGSKIGLGISAPGGRFIAIAPDPAGSNDASTISTMNVYPNTNDPGLEQFRQAQKEGTDSLKRLVTQQFQTVGWKSTEILTYLQDSNDFYASEICQVKIPTLYKGRVVLVGDAGYASGPTGTGTSLALAGAYILAGEIAAARRRGDGVATGLRAYEARIRPIVDDMHVIPPGALTFMAPQTVWGIWLRNLVFVVVCWGMNTFSGFFGWLASFWAVGFGKDKYGLPEYEWLE